MAGLRCLVNDSYKHSAEVMYRSEICRISIDLMNNLSELFPQISKDLMASWQRNLETSETVTADLSTGSAEARVARLLLLLDGPTNGQPLPHISRDDMGALLAITPETASRVMADFRRRGLITQLAPNTHGYDQDGLTRIALD